MKLAHTQLTENELQKRHYAFPEKRKFPLPDRGHVLSAIRFFNYVSPNEERILANAILKRMKELGMSNVNVGPTNKFHKYYSGPELKHHGVKGMKWGVWNEETKARRDRKLALRKDSSTKDYTIKKDANIQRLVTTGSSSWDSKAKRWVYDKSYEERISDLKNFGDRSFQEIPYNSPVKRTYVSLNEPDNETYKKWYSTSTSVFNMELSAVDDLKIAGGKKVIEECLRIDAKEFGLSDREKLANELAKTDISNMVDLNRWLMKKDPKPVYNYGPNVLDYYDQVDPSMGGPYSYEVIDSLKKQGYSGMKDLWDGSTYAKVFQGSISSGKKRIGKKTIDKLLEDPRDPTIIFDPDKNIKINDVTLLRDDSGTRVDKNHSNR